MYTPVNPYISLVEIIEELKLKSSDVDNEPKLKDELLRAIDRASRWVDTYTQRDYFFHDFSVNPIVFDQFSQKVYGFEIFFPFKPIISVDKIVLGTDAASGTEMVFNQDFFNDDSRLYLLRSSRMFVQNVDVPHDGGGLSVGGCRGGWNLSRPDRMLFVFGKGGNPQALFYFMTASGTDAGQTDAWKLSAYAAPTALYWTIKLAGTKAVVTVTTDSFGAQVVASGSALASGPQLVTLCEVNGSGITGQVSINYSADSTAANTLAVTPSTPTPVNSASVPQGIEGKITISTRLVAASLSGHNRKEIAGLDGQTTDITDRSIPKTVFQLLGRQNPILV